MAPQGEWSPGAPTAGSSELLPAVGPSEVLPVAASSKLLQSAAPSELLPTAALSELLHATASSEPYAAAGPSSWLSICGSGLPLQYRLSRLAALATRADAAASSHQSTSSGRHRHMRQGSTSPSPRIALGDINVQEGGGQKSKKRKSPCVVMPPFPLSRMMLSPKTQLLAPWLRSPSVRHETSPSTSTCDTPYGQGQRVMGEIDLNMTPGDSSQENRDNQLGQENGDNQLGQDNGDNQLGQENGDNPLVQENGDNQLGEENGDNQLSQENGDTQLSQENVDDQLVQENARRKLVLDDMRRRVIFETLLGRARNGNLKGNDTKEVSIQFSVPLRTVQRIWKKRKKLYRPRPCS
ncbi:hypothetical protein PVAP13_7NG430066 [Panicum virgatum]|uniref:DUF7769 domain-containing protein n=1 Tax=Panicum virgatum TaxID=38727 RepID=A0A8T0Q8P5_PANVG|nr:hypothetical protein PVAP13_7NG430066 [Panicum virgatum]